ncbi:MAG: hypothetical protein ATN31_04600 [Candidatus Epulonipiscioides saccharophilum]|nr:MAG: hypothetical protein ATN31_04600 [Epulopiscium sp. AS2M-Bin001]
MKNKKIDIVLVILILVIVLFGVVMVYSASNYHAFVMYGDPFSLARKQGIFAILGICAMLLIGTKIDYRIFSNMKIAGALYIGANALVALLPLIGHESKGATRWIMIGPITVQPSEFAKIATIIMVSAFIVNYRNKLEKWPLVICGFTIIAIPAILVLFENMSSAIVIGAAGVFIMFVATKDVWYYVAGLLGAVGMGWLGLHLAATTQRSQETTGLIGIVFPQYRLDRFRVWLDPWIDPQNVGYQPIQSLYAIGAGGLFGQGLGSSIQKQGFLPEPHNDIIFSVICEELGLIGASCVLLIYALFVVRGLMIAINADDLFGSLVATGLVGLVAVQVLINVAVNTNTFPTTGMQLPMISYGGTALVVLLGSLGILLSISKYSKIEKLQ